MPYRIALLIHALYGGGAERAAVALANHWASRGHQLTLITLDRIETDEFSVDSRVKRIGLGMMSEAAHPVQGLWNNLKRVSAVRKAVRGSGASIAVSLTDKMNIVTLMACRPLKLPVVINERNNPAMQNLGFAWEWLRRRSYPGCRAAVAQTEAVAGQLKKVVASERLHVIPNGVKKPTGVWIDDPARPPRIVAVGRLSPQKGFDLLIRAFARLAEKHTGWELQIAGEGPERSSLEGLVTELNLDMSVSLPGWVESANEVLCSSRVFALPSRYEGFPNALLEAMATGVPVVSYDCEFGPGEMIQHEVNGLLVPAENVQLLARELERLMLDADLRQRLSQRAREVVDQYKEGDYFDRWDALLEECLGRDLT